MNIKLKAFSCSDIKKSFGRSVTTIQRRLRKRIRKDAGNILKINDGISLFVRKWNVCGGGKWHRDV